MSGPDDRPRGLLTPKDRALLRGEIEYSNQQQYSNRYQDIRERISNGILDFNLIWTNLRNRDRKRIFQDPSNEANVEDATFFPAVGNMLYWTYLGLKEQKYDFEGLLTDAVEQAEEDFARKYWGKSVDVNLQFDIDVTRSDDIDDLIALVEDGGPVKANRLYDLLEVPGGVPIDTSELDTLRVWFQSSFPEGEKAVIETLFSEYIGADVDVKNAVARVPLTDLDIERSDAVVDKDKERPDPGDIKGLRTDWSFDSDSEQPIRPSVKKDLTDSNEGNDTPDPLEELFEGDEEEASSIRELMDEPKQPGQSDEGITPDDVIELLEQVDEQFVSTAEVAAVLGVAPEAARQPLKSLLEESRVRHRPVVADDEDRIGIWWCPPTQEPAHT